jgi:hypothetical protein
MKEAVLRTLVPIVYALIIKSGVVEWLGIEDVLAQNVAALLGAALLYVALRAAEKWKAQLGWLLGYPSQPSYGETPPNPPVPPHADPAKIDTPVVADPMNVDGRHEKPPFSERLRQNVQNEDGVIYWPTVAVAVAISVIVFLLLATVELRL